MRGFLPGRQRLRCSFANVHSQGARWVILFSSRNPHHVAHGQPFAV
jgi:ATP sulfurylase